MDNLIMQHPENIMIQKGQFKNELQARQHIQGLYPNTYPTQQLTTDNFYQYKHQRVVPEKIQNANGRRYKETIQPSRGMIYSIGTTDKIISHDLHRGIDHESLYQQPMEYKQSLYNTKLKQNANVIVNPNHKRPGQDGTGIWQNRAEYVKIYPPKQLQTDMALKRNANKYL